MQNMNQITISNAESIINAPLPTKYSPSTYYPHPFSSHPEKISLRNAQFGVSLPQRKENQEITSLEKEQKENLKSDNILLERKGYSIYLINSLKQRIKVSTLIKHMYAWRGYCTKDTSVFSSNPFQITFAAYNKQTILGTITLTIDSDKGLLADQHYKQEVNNFRKKNRIICEVSKLALNFNSNSKEILASLFHVSYIYAHYIFGAQDALIEINPRHALFYKRVMGFRQVGAIRTCQRVNAPAVLLHLDRDHIRDQITTQVGCFARHSKKSIYCYFLSEHEEESVIDRIKQMP